MKPKIAFLTPRGLKTFALVFTAIASFATSGQAQILGSFYDGTGGQSPSTAQDFIDAGVTGISDSAAVDGFNLTVNGTAPFTSTSSNGLTVASSISFPFPTSAGNGSGVYQYSLVSDPETSLTVSGLSAQLSPNSTYTLYAFGFAPFGDSPGATTIGFSYGSESGTMDFSAGGPRGSVAEFTITTGSSPTDVLTLTDTYDDTPANFIGLTGFAITGLGAAPEPSTNALMGVGFALLLLTLRYRRSVR